MIRISLNGTNSFIGGVERLQDNYVTIQNRKQVDAFLGKTNNILGSPSPNYPGHFFSAVLKSKADVTNSWPPIHKRLRLRIKVGQRTKSHKKKNIFGMKGKESRERKDASNKSNR